MGEPLEDVEFLARSGNRTRVLDALVDAPATRKDLAARTHVERVTLGRTLGDLEERGWIRRDGDEYAATPLGRLVADAFGELVETVTAASRLRPVMDWEPPDGFEFGLERLADARLTVPAEGKPFEPMRRAVERIHTADHLRMLLDATSPELITAIHEAVTSGQLTLTAVACDRIVEAVAKDPDSATQCREIASATGASLARYDGSFPCHLAVDGDDVTIVLEDDRGVPAVLIESDDEVVAEWALATFERYHEAAEPIPSELADAHGEGPGHRSDSAPP